MQKRVKFVISVVFIGVVLSSLITIGLIYYVNQPLILMTGSLYFNDSGESHGGFEAAMQWNITLAVRAGSGLLVVTPEPGYMNNDRLGQWSYPISRFHITEELIMMVINGQLISLPFVENDTVWNTYHDYYIGRTPDIVPTIFPGFLSHYYVEFRLASVDAS